MKIIKQEGGISIHNLDNIVGEGVVNDFKRHGNLLPASLRCIISGPSNSGKSNIILSLIFADKGLKFDNIYIYSKTLYQPKYQYLESILQGTSIGYHAFKDNSEILAPNEAEENSIFIFDDILNEKNLSKVREFFSQGRHKKVDSFFLGQTYTRIPKHLIRDNCNFLILFKQDLTNIKHVYEEHVGTDMTFKEFLKICDFCWQRRYDFLVIDKDADLNSGRYRKCLDEYIVIDKQN